MAKKEAEEIAEAIPIPELDDDESGERGIADKDKDIHTAEPVPGLRTPTDSTVNRSVDPSASSVKDARVDKLEAAVAALTAKVESQGAEVTEKIGEVTKRVEEVAKSSQQLVKNLSLETQNLMSTLAQNFSAMLDA
eukprot:4373810-Alexandrium_andersonii.AAC.1